MSQIDEIRAKHHAIDLDAPEPSLGPYCLADFEPWPCDTVVALAEADRLAKEALFAESTVRLLNLRCDKNKDELDRLEAEIKLAVHEGYYGVEQGHSDTDTLDAVMVALAAW
jgi:hypothetical protein